MYKVGNSALTARLRFGLNKPVFASKQKKRYGLPLSISGFLLVVAALVFVSLVTGCSNTQSSISGGYIMPVSEIGNRRNQTGINLEYQGVNNSTGLVFGLDYTELNSTNASALIGVNEFDERLWFVNVGKETKAGIFTLGLSDDKYQVKFKSDTYVGKKFSIEPSAFHRDNYAGKHSRTGLGLTVWYDVTDLTKVGVSYTLNNIGKNGNFTEDKAMISIKHYFEIMNYQEFKKR